MGKRHWGIALLVGALAITGCASTPEPISEAEFLRQMSAIPSYGHLDDAVLVELAEGMCDTLSNQDDEEGRTQVAEYYSAIAEDEQGNGFDAARFIDSSIARFCPDLTVSR